MPRPVHFDIHADNPERAVKFYESVFGWKTQKWANPGMDYWMFTTGDEKEPGINGGLSKRTEREQTTYNTLGVTDVEEYSKKVTANGGKVLMPKSPIQGVGWFALCTDTEGNPFGIIQMDDKAK